MAAPQDSAAAGLIIDSGEESPSRAARVKRVSWFMTSVLLMADVMGTGVLSLPSAASSIGWVLTCFSLVVFALCATYSGILLSNVRNDFFPSATSYAEVAALTGGAAFGTFTKMAILVNWGALLPYFLISLSESIALIDPRLCQWQSSLIGLALLLLPCQARTMHYISFLAVPSTLAILVSVACALATLDNLHAPTTAGPAPDQGFLQVYSAFSSFIFAYQVPITDITGRWHSRAARAPSSIESARPLSAFLRSNPLPLAPPPTRRASPSFSSLCVRCVTPPHSHAPRLVPT
jgi:hypothetical protein